MNLVKEVNAIEDLYIYKKVGNLNSHVLSIVQFENRTLDFHIHEYSDELFYVIDGSFYLETEERKTKVNSGKFIIVPKGMKHRPIVISANIKAGISTSISSTCNHCRENKQLLINYELMSTFLNRKEMT